MRMMEKGETAGEIRRGRVRKKLREETEKH